MANDKSDPKAAVFTAEQMSDAIKAVAKSVAEEMAPVMVAVTQRSGGPAPTGKKFGSNDRCFLCRQRKNACGGVPAHNAADPKDVLRAYAANHELLVVFPQKYPEFGDFFQGRKINGVRYLSGNSKHRVWVPRAAVGDIMRAVQEYEENERQTRMGRRKEHNSGTSAAPAPATTGWR